MKIFKFLLTVIFWILLVAILLLLVHFRDYHEAYRAFETIDPQAPLSTWEIAKSYFRYTDQWNELYFSIILSVLLIFFALNDYFIKRKLYRQIKSFQSFSYLTAVGVWIVQKLAAAVLVFIQFLIISNLVIILSTGSYIKKDVGELEEKQYALLLGTNKKLRTRDGDNVYYFQRIRATERLYKSGKVNKIIISGDNSIASYNEPGDMKKDLIARGINPNAIMLDHAGFRTLDSIIRLKYHFKVDQVTVISQGFHLQRALFLAWFYNIKAEGLQAKGGMTRAMFQRELLAKPKAIIDVFILNMQPKFGRAESRQPIQMVRKDHKILVATALILLITASWFFIRSLKFQLLR